MDSLAENLDDGMLDYEREWYAANGKRGGLSAFMSRENCIKKYGFAIPTREAISALIALGPLLEVGAGSGYWTHEVRCAGGDIIGTEPDTLTDDPEALVRWRKKWTKIEKWPAIDAIMMYPNRALFMCWPSYQEAWSGEALKAYTGNVFALVAEDRWGCVGGQELWDEIAANWKLSHYVNIPQWDGIHDVLEFFQRK